MRYSKRQTFSVINANKPSVLFRPLSRRPCFWFGGLSELRKQPQLGCGTSRAAALVFLYTLFCVAKRFSAPWTATTSSANLKSPGDRVAHLGILDQENHEEGHDCGAGIDDELPSVAVAEHWASGGHTRTVRTAAMKTIGLPHHIAALRANASNHSLRAGKAGVSFEVV